MIGTPLKGKNITLDLHGSVPEELEFYGKRFKSLFYNEVEKIAYKHVTNLIMEVLIQIVLWSKYREKTGFL